MNIEMRHGPKDGERRFLPIGRASETMIIEVKGKDYLYRKTERLTTDGYIVYQCLGIVTELLAS